MMESEIEHALYAIAYDELGEAGANAIWKIWCRLPGSELYYLYSVLSADPKVAGMLAKYYIAQHKAMKSGLDEDYQVIADALEVLLGRLERVSLAAV